MEPFYGRAHSAISLNEHGIHARYACHYVYFSTLIRVGVRFVWLCTPTTDVYGDNIDTHSHG